MKNNKRWDLTNQSKPIISTMEKDWNFKIKAK